MRPIQTEFLISVDFKIGLTNIAPVRRNVSRIPEIEREESVFESGDALLDGN